MPAARSGGRGASGALQRGRGAGCLPGLLRLRRHLLRVLPGQEGAAALQRVNSWQPERGKPFSTLLRTRVPCSGERGGEGGSVCGTFAKLLRLGDGTRFPVSADAGKLNKRGRDRFATSIHNDQRGPSTKEITLRVEEKNNNLEGYECRPPAITERYYECSVFMLDN